MTFDFRASQLRTSKIIASGSTGTNGKLLLYPISAQGSPLNQGNIDPTLFGTGSIGQDVFLYVSGAVGGIGGTGNDIALFGGDVYSSGNLKVLGDINAENVTAVTSLSALNVRGIQFFGNNAPEFYFFVNGFKARFNVVSGFGGGVVSFRSQGNISFQDGSAFSGSLSASLTGERIWYMPDASGDVTLTDHVLAGPNITVNTYAGGYVGITGSGGGSGPPLGSSTPLSLNPAPSSGTSLSASREDHTHKRPSAADIGAIQDVLSSDGDVAMRLSFATVPFTTTATGRKVMQITPGAPNDVLTYVGGNPIWSPASSGKFNTAYQFVAGYNSTLLTDPGTVCGQVAFLPTELTTSSVILRTILTTATGSNTVFVRLYNHTSGAYVCLGGGTTLELSSSATTPPEIVQSVNLVGATNWSTGAAIYELQLFTSNSLYLGILGSAQFVCT